MQYRVYQNMTEFGIDVEADNEKEAIKIATSTANMDKWERYEPNEDNITYEAVCQEPEQEQSLESLLVEAIGYVCDYLNEWENNDPQSYTSSDKVLMMNDFLKAVEDYGNKKLIEAIKPNPKDDK